MFIALLSKQCADEKLWSLDPLYEEYVRECFASDGAFVAKEYELLMREGLVSERVGMDHSSSNLTPFRDAW